MATKKRPPPTQGRPKGAKSFDPFSAAIFGEEVRRARTGAGIFQEGLALAANVERSYLGRVERGKSQPTLFVVLKIAAALGVAAGDLVSQVERRITA
jgi:transcriptional regulator with XRE-family HTH domain